MPAIERNYDTVIIIGNGFDLNQELRTGYNHFIDSDFFKKHENINGNILFRHLKQQQNIQNWIDLENELKVVASKGHDKNLLKKQFELLSSNLYKYIESIKLQYILKETHSYNLINHILDKEYIIFDFNYTNTVSTILQDFGLHSDSFNSRLIKIHGSIEEKNILIGVEDAPPNFGREYVFLKKAFSKNFKAIDFTRQLSNAYEIHIFGHSLGETDHNYFENYFNEIVTSSKRPRQRFFLYHYGEEAYVNLHYQLDKLSSNKLSVFKSLNDFRPIDTSLAWKTQ